MSDAELEIIRGVQADIRRIHNRMDEKSLLESRVEEIGATVSRIEAMLQLQDKRYALLEARVTALERAK